jgi:hypothetical protein
MTNAEGPSGEGASRRPRGTELSPEWILAQFGKIEEDNRRLRKLSRFLAVCAVVFLAVTITIGVRELILTADVIREGPTLQAQNFVLTGPDGEPRGRWSVAQDGTSALYLMDAAGVERIRMSVVEGGSPGVSLLDHTGDSRLVLGVLPDGTGTVVFADSVGVPRIVLGMARDGSANIVFADQEGLTRAGLGVNSRGEPALLMPEPTDDPNALPTSGSGGEGDDSESNSDR